MKKIITLFALLLLSGCASDNLLTEFRFQTVTAPPYVIASWFDISEPGKPLRIYIEGDGNAFDSSGHPSNNPTPRTTTVRELAANDPNPNIAYLGRPCQYFQTSTCSVQDWSTGRFSPQIINAMNQTMHQMMKKARTNQVILIGYSGGAQIAGLLAVKNPHIVQKVITIAGVLDQKAWTTYHGDTPLTDSLNLKDKQAAFEKIPQVHYVGDKDSVVPMQLTQAFVTNPDSIIVVKGADHEGNFKKVADDIYDQN